MENHDEILDKVIVRVIESAHEESLSDNPQSALLGRVKKASIESLLRWFDAEERRGSDISDIILGASYFFGGVAAKIAVSVRDNAKDGQKIPDNKKITKAFNDSLLEESIIAMERIENN
jgi:hypothetical protein